jgi:hypothetical protein
MSHVPAHFFIVNFIQGYLPSLQIYRIGDETCLVARRSEHTRGQCIVDFRVGRTCSCFHYDGKMPYYYPRSPSDRLVIA